MAERPRSRRAELVFHPVRMRILHSLLRDGPSTAARLGDVLPDVPPATLYRHLKRLAEGGAIEVVEERPVRGVVERVYAAAAGASLGREELEGIPPEAHLRYFGVFVAGLLESFQRYLEGGAADLARDRAGYRQFPMHLSDAEADELIGEMNELLSRAMRNEPRPDRRRRVLTRILIPAPETENDTDR